MSFAWTKFQDFYLRLGYLKVLAAVLDPSRRSALNQALERRLTTPLFEPAEKHKQLWNRAAHLFPAAQPRVPSKKFVTVGEALLASGGCPSVLFAITPDTTYKILDWGHDVLMMGRGNQITERALVLRALMPMDEADKFLAGDVTAWDPFSLSVAERLFFLYHLGEIDHTMISLIDGLARVEAGTVLEASDAARLLCKTFFDFLSSAEHRLLPRETPRYRVALDLACVIAEELELNDFRKICGGRTASRKIGKAGAKRPGLSRTAESQRRTTKSADHQTIPRFEQLTDLGFLNKVHDGKRQNDDPFGGRKRWRYIPTEASRRWYAAKGNVPDDSPFLWNGFAKAAVRAYELGSASASASEGVIVTYLWRAYERIRRPMGHTPFDSVALLALIYAAVDGIAIEIRQFHDLMLRVRQAELAPNHAFFASGNEIEKMFILLKPGFVEALSKVMPSV